MYNTKSECNVHICRDAVPRLFLLFGFEHFTIFCCCRCYRCWRQCREETTRMHRNNNKKKKKREKKKKRNRQRKENFGTQEMGIMVKWQRRNSESNKAMNRAAKLNCIVSYCNATWHNGNEVCGRTNAKRRGTSSEILD